MIHRTNIVMAVVCVATLLALGVGWFALGQDTNTPAPLTTGMESPLVKDINMERKVDALTTKVDALETIVVKLQNEIDEINAKKTTGK
jgi:hypothetical protein